MTPAVARVEFRSLCVLAVRGKNKWMLTTPFAAELVFESGEVQQIRVPEGFVTDLASVPRLPGMFLLFGGRARMSAVLHDYLYALGHDRAFADRVFCVAMRREESFFTRALMCAAVRLAGWTAWRRKPKVAGA